MAPHPGGGGLVILPHKSWNVWNQDNKEKVARDERANSELIAAKEECRKVTLQQIRFERLTGKTITKKEEEERVQNALDTMNINDYIKDKSMREIAKNINDKKERETNNKKKRKHRSKNLSEDQLKYSPRKRHKRNDVTIIEDHYSTKSKFSFDPNQYEAVHDKKDINHQQIDDDKQKKSHFSIFNERDLRNKHNETGYKNQEIIKEEKKKNEMKDYQQKFGRTEIEQRGKKKPWYLMTNQREIDRRNLMKSAEIQRSLPRRLKDFNRRTDELRQKAMERKNIDDPINLMQKYLNKQKMEKNMNMNDTVKTEKKTKKELKKQKKDLLRRIKRERKNKRKETKRHHSKHREDEYNDSDYGYYSDLDGMKKRKKKKRTKKKKKKHYHESH